MTQLVLGCGDDRYEDSIHVDMSPAASPDVLWDLNKFPWPFEDNSATGIVAERVLEHLDDTVKFMDECWRIMAPKSVLYVKVPRFSSPDAWRDPTHKRPFHEDQFKYFDPTEFYGQKYGKFYTSRMWRIIRLEYYEDIDVWMVPIKE